MSPQESMASLRSGAIDWELYQRAFAAMTLFSPPSRTPQRIIFAHWCTAM